MIPRSFPTWQTSDWQNEQANAIRDPEQLLTLLKLSKDQLPAALQAHQLFNLRVPSSYLRRMEIGNPNDPLLRQVLPLGDELHTSAEFVDDPVGDINAMARPGLLHKYRGRCLLLMTSACGVHCRYCFRRNFPYQEARLDSNAWQQAIDYIRADETLHEVILSGGDPLTLSDRKLAELLAPLQTIPHLKRLRIHTRQPVVLPSRITSELVQLLQQRPWPVAMVLHFNHANEIDHEVRQALQPLQQAGIQLLNQAVLLRGINDTVADQAVLSESLFAAGVLPYYLHLLDRARGTAHFETTKQAAKALHLALREHLPGYLVPRLVMEIPGKPFKEWV